MKDLMNIDELIEYLDNQGIRTTVDDKQSLINMGYYHGYKGYRYIKNPSNKIVFSNFKELIAIYEFDNKIKELLYPMIMHIETAFKSIALERLVIEGNSKLYSDVYNNLMTCYREKSLGSEEYKKANSFRLSVNNKIQNEIAKRYVNNDEIVTYYLSKDKPIPIWATIEILSLGDFGNMVSSLSSSIKKKLAKDFGFNIAFDSGCKIAENTIFILQEIRNAVAHNKPVFDVRFKNRKIGRSLSQEFLNNTGIRKLLFNCILDYFIFILYLEYLLKEDKKKLLDKINAFEVLMNELYNQVPKNIYKQILLSDSRAKIGQMKILFE